MTLRDISYWGLFKLSLVLDFLILILLSPLIGLTYLIAPDRVQFDVAEGIRIYGVIVKTGDGNTDLIGLLISIILIGFIGLMIKCAVLTFIFRKTPIGKIVIGR